MSSMAVSSVVWNLLVTDFSISKCLWLWQYSCSMWSQQNSVVHSINWREGRNVSQLASPNRIICSSGGEQNIWPRMSSIALMWSQTNWKSSMRHSREGISWNKMRRSSKQSKRCCKFKILRQQPERLKRDTMVVMGKGPPPALCINCSREGTLITSKNFVPPHEMFSKCSHGWRVIVVSKLTVVIPWLGGSTRQYSRAGVCCKRLRQLVIFSCHKFAYVILS